MTLSHQNSHALITLVNCLAGSAPEYLIELCHSVTDISARRNLRSSSQFQLLVPRYRKERSGKRGFSVSSPQLWNLLPVDIRLLHNDHQLFRKRLKTHYMQQSMLCHWGSTSTVWTLLLLLLQPFLKKPGLSKSDPNVRPISNFNTIGKILGRLALARLLHHLSISPSFSPL